MVLRVLRSQPVLSPFKCKTVLPFACIHKNDAFPFDKKFAGNLKLISQTLLLQLKTKKELGGGGDRSQKEEEKINTQNMKIKISDIEKQ